MGNYYLDAIHDDPEFCKAQHKAYGDGLNKAAQELGKKGGQAKSEKKTAAVRANAKLPRGKWVTGVAYQFEDVSGDAVCGLILMQGKWYPETTAGFPQTKKMIEEHSGKKMSAGSSQLDVEHLLVK